MGSKIGIFLEELGVVHRAMTLKTFYNLIYFNIFKFHCFFQYWVASIIFSSVKLTGLGGLAASHHKRDDWDKYLIEEVLNSPEMGVSKFMTDRFMAVLECCLILILWNLISSLFQINFDYWKNGMILIGVLVAIAGFFYPEYLKDFKKFEAWAPIQKRKYEIVTFLTVTGIFTVFVLSFILNLSVAIGNKPKI